MEDIRGNLGKINEQIKLCAEKCGRKAEDVLLCAVSKTRTPEEINIAIDAGVTDIGENKVQEIMDKFVAACAEKGTVDKKPVLDGRILSMVIVPLKK